MRAYSVSPRDERFFSISDFQKNYYNILTSKSTLPITGTSLELAK